MVLLGKESPLFTPLWTNGVYRHYYFRDVTVNFSGYTAHDKMEELTLLKEIELLKLL